MTQLEEANTKLRLAWASRDATEKVCDMQNEELVKLREKYAGMVLQVEEVEKKEKEREAEFNEMKAGVIRELANAKEAEGNILIAYYRSDVESELESMTDQRKKRFTDDEWLAFQEQWHGTAGDWLSITSEAMESIQHVLSDMDYDKEEECHRCKKDISHLPSKLIPGPIGGDSLLLCIPCHEGIEKELRTTPSIPCLMPGCTNVTQYNWCEECIKDKNKSQHGSFPLKAEPAEEDAKRVASLQGHLDAWGRINAGDKRLQKMTGALGPTGPTDV